MDTGQLPYLLAFNSLSRLKANDVLHICSNYGGDAAAAWTDLQDWIRQTYQGKAKEDLLREWAMLDPGRLFEAFLASGSQLTCLTEADYPAALASIIDPPLLLFYHGHLPKASDLCLAVVGSRKASPYGYQVAEIFSRDLALHGVVIVSGMARGVDSYSHKAALSVGGDTVAVLGSGIDVIYPPENSRLYRQIAEQGAVVSEFPLGTEAVPYNFPRRNRIISGLSRAVLVVEASEKSGTLHTVDHALDQGKEVFAVPGSVLSATSRGSNRLLREGAKMVLAPEDILLEFGFSTEEAKRKPRRSAQAPQKPKMPQMKPEEQQLLELLRTPLRVEEILASEQLQIDASSLGALLTMLEIRGLVRQFPGQYYQAITKTIRA